MSPSRGVEAEATGRGSLGNPFRRLWLGATSSALGDGMWFAALPLLAASLSRDPRLVSLLEVAAGLPWLIFGLHAGAAADRLDRRRLMWTADVIRVGLVVVLAVLVLTGTATVAALVIVVFALASVGTLFASAAPALLPGLVPPDVLHRANARLSLGVTTGRDLIGPPAGAVLYGLVAWIPLAANALSFGISAWAVRRLPKQPAEPAEPADLPGQAVAGGSVRRDIVDGLDWIRRTPTMVVLVASWALLGVASGAFLGVFVLVVLEVLALPAAAYGLMMAGFAVGGLVGGSAVAGLITRFGVRSVVRLAAATGTVGFLGIAASRDWPVMAGFLALLGVATMTWTVAALTLRQRITPGRLLGRVAGTVNMVTVGAAPLGAAIGGLVAKSFGLMAPVVLAAILSALATALVCLRPIDIGGAPPGGEPA
jgi:MFS family permease